MLAAVSLFWSAWRWSRASDAGLISFDSRETREMAVAAVGRLTVWKVPRLRSTRQLKVMGIDWRYGIARMMNVVVTSNSTTNVCLPHVWANISCCRQPVLFRYRHSTCFEGKETVKFKQKVIYIYIFFFIVFCLVTRRKKGGNGWESMSFQLWIPRHCSIDCCLSVDTSVGTFGTMGKQWVARQKKNRCKWWYEQCQLLFHAFYL